MSKHKQTAPEREPRAPEERGDELVHVPKGQSRLRFFLLVGLIVLLLIIFVVPSQFMALFAPSQPSEQAFLTWTHPRLGRQEVSYVDFLYERRRFEDFFRLVSPNLDVRDVLTDEEIARLIVTDAVAYEAGVDVSRREIAKTILEGDVFVFADSFVQLTPFGTKEHFLQAMRAIGTTPADFESTLRRVLRIVRYEGMVAGVLMRPLPADIEAAWKEQHREHAFDVVAVEVASMQAQADAEVPDEAGLQAWYDAMQPGLKRGLFRDEWKRERASAELALLRFDGGDAAALLASYPRPEGTDLDRLAQEYYDLHAFTRFRRPEGLPDAPTPQERMFLPFADVAERARAEAQIKAAFADFVAALQTRAAAGETVDLAAEAAALGLAYSRVDEPRTQADWQKSEDVGAQGGPALAAAIITAARNQKWIAPTLGEAAIACGRVLAHEVESAPALADVRDKAVAEWKKERVVELAKQKLQNLRATLVAAATPAGEQVPPSPVVDEAAFQAKATEAGLVVTAVEWFDPGRAKDELTGAPSLAERLARETRRAGRFLLDLEAGAVPAVYVDSDKAYAWLIRSRGSRDAATVDIRPDEVEGLMRSAGIAAYQRLRDRVLGLDAYRAKFGLRLAGEGAAGAAEGGAPAAETGKSDEGG
jgi:hypothetical protein